ncbi:putative sugar epimerase YhfK [Nocardioides aquaticus]|uniref:Sugar epimerase YhfK n=1 Tax=Nocardioides aquaticus TaxID=160826 RepID=A0ABX8EMG5_9ACTN|nr:SDR family oxidoreductase [Nocardioides aquaticus]QVT81469.1 putative sugar epimerase YhfK [Nocardioides aquaticus]
MSKVIIVGAHGKVARLAAPRLVAAGHEVTGVIRKEEQADAIREIGAEPLVADVESASTDEITRVVTGHDVVVWSAGAGGGSPERTWALDRDAAIRTIDAAVAAGVPRFVMVSYFGAGPDHGVDPEQDFFAYAESKTQADAHLSASDLAWTILRPSGLTEEAGTGGIETGPGVTGGQVARATVADVIAAAVDAPDAAKGVTLEFNDGDQQVADVFA